MKRIFSILLLITLVLGMIPFGVSAAEVTLEDEIKNTMIGGKLFNESDYPAKTGAAAKIFGFSEVGYTYSGNFEKFGMYVYVYNPSQKTVKTNGSHQALMAVKFDADGNALAWEEFTMTFVEKTDNNRFLKFKIVDHVSTYDGKKIVTRVKRDARRYAIAELEIHYEGNVKATEAEVGQSYVFTGFSADNNLKIETWNFEVFRLDDDDIHHTFFRTETSTKGDGYRNQLDTVYFSVPEQVLNAYGEISAFSASWNEQKLAPFIVCNNKDIVDNLSEYVGVDISNGSKPTYGFYDYENVMGVSTIYPIAYNAKPLVDAVKRLTTLPYIYYSSSLELGEVVIDAETLISLIQDNGYPSYMFADAVDDQRKKGHNDFSVSLKDKDKYYDLDNRDSNTWWQKFFNFTLWGLDEQESFYDVPPIYKVTAADMLIMDKEELAERLLVDVNDIDDIRAAYNAALLKNETLWLFRFAATDYYAHDISFWNKNGFSTSAEGMWFEQTVFLDFNLIELTYEKNGVETVFPIVMSKVDYTGDGVAPNTDGPSLDNLSGFDWNLDGFKMVVSVLLVLILFATFIPLIADLVRWAFPHKRE